jgi:hypothetical protein
VVFTLATAGQNIYLRPLNLAVLKIAPLLAQYLYTHKRLDLPGLGIFLLDPSAHIEPDNGKQNRSVNLDGVSFESKPSIKETPELIQFISSQTGKIKALAAADLESHLGLALQFLNIGKPFLFEGIGSLSKIRSGEFSFTSGQVIPFTVKEEAAKENISASYEESVHDYKSVLYPRKTKTKWKKPIAILLLISGLGLAIWGGYTVYKKTSSKNDSLIAEDNAKKEETVLIADSVGELKDSVAPVAQTAITPAGNFKFVLEKANAKRAFYRLNLLKNNLWNVQMETKDSVTYTLFMLLPATSADTTRIIDSLRILNGKPVHIE